VYVVLVEHAVSIGLPARTGEQTRTFVIADELGWDARKPSRLADAHHQRGLKFFAIDLPTVGTMSMAWTGRQFERRWKCSGENEVSIGAEL
jgi:hypothetical protein